MKMDRFFLVFAISCSTIILPVLIRAQDQSGFISIDCGIADGSRYVDETTGINYVSDETFIQTGAKEQISSDMSTKNIDKQYLNLRSFPEGTKSCYTLNATQGKNNKHLIRAGFMYGNYDRKGDIPKFDLYLGVNWWETVILDEASSLFTAELIYVPSSNYIDICLVNTGFGTPFISVLELRPLYNDIYVMNESGSLENMGRYDCGLTGDRAIRFPEDIYDRIWFPFNSPDLKILRTNSTVRPSNKFQVPSVVMETAVTLINDNYSYIYFSWLRDNPNSRFYIYLHFAEIQELKTNQYREFIIYLNDEIWLGAFSPEYLRITTVYNTKSINSTSNVIEIFKTDNSTLLPLLNAFEIYFLKEFLQSETNQQDVEAILNIRATYGLKRYWQGDPCAPLISVWDGLNCSYNGHNPPRIISLDLSSSGLSGPISYHIFNLKMLQFLDLSNNSLTGPVPDFLSQLQFLRFLDLSRNKLSGSIPLGLNERSKNGTLVLNVRKNPKLCSSNPCKTEVIVPVIATIGSVCIVSLIAGVAYWSLKVRKHGAGHVNEHLGASELKEHHFTYSAILNITNNLDRVVGTGKSGTVYHSYLDDIQVAIKIFSPPYMHGYEQFQAEAKLLTRIHHRNLTTYYGYCNEDNNKGLIYEYMANGNLQDLLLDENLLSWQERLQIAIDVAQGLEFLHNGFKPPIIHGNLKPTNILLDKNFIAKLVDFGLSKILTAEDAATGYIDPEYYITNKLVERHDVYSLGVILLVTITRQHVLAGNPEKTHVIHWVRYLLGKGDINSIVDSRLEGDFHIDSAWKAVELGMACVSSPSVNRPTMIHVVKELHQCLAMEIARINRSEGAIELVSVNLVKRKEEKQQQE